MTLKNISAIIFWSLNKKKERLGEIGDQYAAFQKELNGAWTSSADLKGYSTIGEDMKCLSDYCDALGSTVEDLTTKKDEWKEKKETAERNRDNEQKLADAPCSC